MEEQETPPVFKNWSTWYLLVMAFMLVQLVAYFLLTNRFS